MLNCAKRFYLPYIIDYHLLFLLFLHFMRSFVFIVQFTSTLYSQTFPRSHTKFCTINFKGFRDGASNGTIIEYRNCFCCRRQITSRRGRSISEGAMSELSWWVEICCCFHHLSTFHIVSPAPWCVFRVLFPENVLCRSSKPREENFIHLSNSVEFISLHYLP